jgi:hypothetical protein
MITAAVVATGLLGGCGALTRVDMATYQSEYAQLYPMGMDHALALKKIEAAGYSCEEPYASGTLMDNGSEVPVKFQHCSRASREMMCPQRRYMRFKFRTSDNKVIQVDEPRMEEKSCF